MGYSCSALASFAQDSLVDQLHGGTGTVDKWGNGCGYSGPSNVWTTKGRRYMYETGREQADGAITGIVWKYTDETHVRRAGSYRIEPDGTISRWPGSTIAQRNAAAAQAVVRFIATFQQWPKIDPSLKMTHPAAHLLTAKFVAV